MVVKAERRDEMVYRVMLSIEEFMVATTLSRSETYALMQRGDLPYVQIGRRRLIGMDDLRAFVRRHRVEEQELAHRRERFAEELPPAKTPSKGSQAQRARRQREREQPLSKRFDAAEATVRKRESVRSVADTAAD